MTAPDTVSPNVSLNVFPNESPSVSSGMPLGMPPGVPGAVPHGVLETVPAGVMGTVLESAAAVCVLLGAGLAFAAGMGMIRFPGTLARMHPATKPQVLGLQLILLAVWLHHPTWRVAGTLLLTGFFQVITATVAAYMVGRAAYRARSPEDDDGTAVPPGNSGEL
ncbi:monovalent cation/H(+) antiporter subunit G [Streptosporangium sp. NPDC051022]|uniref:monovalent cation/H(+) antiporter subunit G n=1 Tax=Streptosporangium sp. NPDC051022 TaxID=3155752 RepID=UPI00342E2CF1